MTTGSDHTPTTEVLEINDLEAFTKANPTAFVVGRVVLQHRVFGSTFYAVRWYKTEAEAAIAVRRAVTESQVAKSKYFRERRANIANAI